MRYVYLGDKLTRPELRGMKCDPVRRADGKCIVSTSMATAMVIDEQGQKHVVLRRRLRLADNTAAITGEVLIGGRRYVTLRRASELVHYDPNSIKYWLATHPDSFHCEKRSGKLCVRLADVLDYAKARQQTRTKWRQIADWWNTHVKEREEIADTYDFHRRLVAAAIDCSPALARWYLAETRPTVSTAHRLLTWLEENPARRHYPLGRVKREVVKALGVSVSKNQVARARKFYDRRHGEHRPPFDMNLYLSTREAAERYRVSRSLITTYAAQGKIDGGIHWRDALYLPKVELEACFAGRVIT